MADRDAFLEHVQALAATFLLVARRAVLLEYEKFLVAARSAVFAQVALLDRQAPFFLIPCLDASILAGFVANATGAVVD